MDAPERVRFFDHLRNSYPEELGATALAATVTPEALFPTVPTWEQQLEILSPERRIAATVTREALVEKYESYGYSVDDFSLIPAIRTGKDGQKEETFAVALSATKAID